MKPSERMRQELQRQRERQQAGETEPPGPPPDESVADRLERLEREQMEERKQAVLRRTGRVVLGEYRRRGQPPRQKRM